MFLGTWNLTGQTVFINNKNRKLSFQVSLGYAYYETNLDSLFYNLNMRRLRYAVFSSVFEAFLVGNLESYFVDHKNSNAGMKRHIMLIYLFQTSL